MDDRREGADELEQERAADLAVEAPLLHDLAAACLLAGEPLHEEPGFAEGLDPEELDGEPVADPQLEAALASDGSGRSAGSAGGDPTSERPAAGPPRPRRGRASYPLLRRRS